MNKKGSRVFIGLGIIIFLLFLSLGLFMNAKQLKLEKYCAENPEDNKTCTCLDYGMVEKVYSEKLTHICISSVNLTQNDVNEGILTPVPADRLLKAEFSHDNYRPVPFEKINNDSVCFDFGAEYYSVSIKGIEYFHDKEMFYNITGECIKAKNK